MSKAFLEITMKLAFTKSIQAFFECLIKLNKNIDNVVSLTKSQQFFLSTSQIKPN